MCEMRDSSLRFRRLWSSLSLSKTQLLYRTINTLSEKQSIVVLPDAVQKVASRTVPIDDTRLPTPVTDALEAAVAEKGAKNLRRKSQTLKEAYRLLSSSRHRGGEQPNFDESKQKDLNSTRSTYYRKRGNDRQRERRSLGQLTHHVPLIGLTSPENSDPELIGLDDYLVTMKPELEDIRERDDALQSINERIQKIRALRGLYDETGAVAYAATHMRGRFATLVRVLGEVAHAAGTLWSPRSLLDYGSGPGTALWAAESVWRSAFQHNPLQAVAVEPSTHMTYLGGTILDLFRQGISDFYKNSNLESDVNAVSDGSSRDLNFPPPLHNSFKTIKWMSRLPNAPVQYDIVVASHVLGEVLDDRERLSVVERLWRHTGKYLVIIEPGTPAGFARVQKARSQVLNTEQEHGAHVTAPCPHDGVCPLLGRQSWCHFVQRYHVNSLHRRISSSGVSQHSQKTTSGGRSYKDEHFSYVVLCKGPRSSVHVDSDVSVEVLHTQTEFPRRRPRTTFQHSRQLKDVAIDNEKLQEQQQRGDLPTLSAEDRERVEASMREMLLESLNTQLSEDEIETELPPELEEELRQFMDAAAFIDADSDDLPNNTSDDEGYTSSSSDSEDVGDEDFSEESEVEEDSLDLNDTISEQNVASQVAIDQSGRRRHITMSEKESNKPPDRTEDEELLLHTASKDWSRMLRAPRKRPGHVVLDVCSAMDEKGRYLGGKEGVLLRQIVSRSHSLHVVGGSEPYKMAKSSRWGDMWPAFYQNTFRNIRIE